MEVATIDDTISRYCVRTNYLRVNYNISFSMTACQVLRNREYPRHCLSRRSPTIKVVSFFLK
jgi:hypothetical protein